MDIPSPTSTVMNVWFFGGEEMWKCGECTGAGAGKPPTVCPVCQLPVLANVVYARSSHETV